MVRNERTSEELTPLTKKAMLEWTDLEGPLTNFTPGPHLEQKCDVSEGCNGRAFFRINPKPKLRCKSWLQW